VLLTAGAVAMMIRGVAVSTRLAGFSRGPRLLPVQNRTDMNSPTSWKPARL
jgi:hypothetical protein